MTAHRGRCVPIALAVSFGLLCVPPPADTEELETTDAQLWLDYDFYGEPKERLRTAFDLGYRQVMSDDQLIGEWLRVHLRGGVAWRTRDWLSLEVGLGGFYTYERDEEEEDTFELRPWQGVKLRWPTFDGPRRLAFTHFARLEQRIVAHDGGRWWRVRFGRARLGRYNVAHTSNTP